jgi:ribosomal protein S18 acetylase RimI-like enzyme
MHTPEIDIRFADKTDSDMLVQFTRALLDETRAFGGHEVNADEMFWLKFYDIIKERINDPDRLFIMACRKGRSVAYLEGQIAGIQDIFTPKRSFHINGVYVDPGSRRLGIAEGLVQKALQWAKEHGCHEADLNVLVGNHAKVLYDKIGFKTFQYEMRIKLQT